MSSTRQAPPRAPRRGRASQPQRRVAMRSWRSADAARGLVAHRQSVELYAPKATTRLADAARRRPSPTLGVGKWLASAPIEACWRIRPFAGLRPYSVPFRPMVQTRPAAMIGGPPPVPVRHARRSEAGDLVARTAVTPLRQGR